MNIAAFDINTINKAGVVYIFKTITPSENPFLPIGVNKAYNASLEIGSIIIICNIF